LQLGRTTRREVTNDAEIISVLNRAIVQLVNYYNSKNFLRML